MNWDQTLQRIHLRGREASEPSLRRAPSSAPRLARAASICIASGKGGTGKSVVTASLASLLSKRGRTLVVDADLGVGNAHLLQDVSPRRSFVDVVQGRCEVSELVTSCPTGVDLVAAGSGVSRMAGLSSYEIHLIAAGLEQLESRYGFLLVDSAAGISEQTVAFAAACDLVVIVTTPDLTAMTDAYAFLKVLVGKRPGCTPMLLVNRVAVDAEHAEGNGASEHTGERVAERIAHVCQKFLSCEPRSLGSVPEDRAVVRSVAARRPLVDCEPGSPAAVALQALTVPLVAELDHLPHPGFGRSLRRLAGFSSASA